LRKVYCHYSKGWISMGRSRTRCPACGAEIGNSDHKVKQVA
jgi:hypothetical protein